jgi:hypothetical protein
MRRDAAQGAAALRRREGVEPRRLDLEPGQRRRVGDARGARALHGAASGRAEPGQPARARVAREREPERGHEREERP